MGMSGVVFAVGVGLLHRLMHDQKLADRDNQMQRVTRRLSIKLREDIHLADRAELIPSDDEGGQILTLRQPSGAVVTYAVRDHVLERAAARESEPVHHDDFQFPEYYQLQFGDVPAEYVTFTAYAVDPARAVTGTDKSRGEVSGVRRAVMRIEASVGRDHRFLSNTGKLNES
jgi:hypothetical protein